MKIVVIGAGLGGLTFGALAARDGHQVEIFDKNGAPGGVVALLEHEGFKFEQGPLLIGDMLETEPVYEFLKTLGITLETERADRGIVMPDYDTIHPDEYAGPYWRREKLKKLLGDAAVFAQPQLAYLRPASVAYLASLSAETVDYLTLEPLYLRAPNAAKNKKLTEAAGHE